MTTSSPKTDPFQHVTVLKAEVLAAVVRAAEGVENPQIVDVTLGGGGHTEAILEALPHARVLGLDQDPAALEAATRRLQPFADRFQAVHAPFGQLQNVMQQQGLAELTAIVADLGVSSHQFDVAERGFSFRLDGPLDMRMDPTRGLPLAERLATVTVEELADVLYAYGDIRRSIGTARIVLQSIEEGANTTGKLANRLAARLDHDRKVHPATLVFQALRMWVNDELGELTQLLRDAPTLLAPGGVLAVISFHSGEDRLVKQAMMAKAPKKYGEFMRGHKLAPGDEEVRMNPRARSARLRTLWRAKAGQRVGYRRADEDDDELDE